MPKLYISPCSFNLRCKLQPNQQNRHTLHKYVPKCSKVNVKTQTIYAQKNNHNSQLITSSSSGLTLFAPEDSAFSKQKPGFLNSLNDRQKVELLQFHTLSSFISPSPTSTVSPTPFRPKPAMAPQGSNSTSPPTPAAELAWPPAPLTPP